MKSKAAIGNHPLHPLIVPIPIGAFFLVLAGDVAHWRTADPFWYRFSTTAIGFGLVFAFLAAIVGAIDYMSLRMPPRAARVATGHALAAISSVVLYAASAVLRQSPAALRSGRWWIAVAFSTAGFLLLGTAGWLGGKLAHEERIGIVDDTPADPLRPQEEPGDGVPLQAAARARRPA